MNSTKFHEKTKQFVIDTLTEINGQPPSYNDVAVVTDKITGALLPGRLPDPHDDDIVEALEAWWTGDESSSKKLRLRAFRLIQAKIQENEQGVEATQERIDDYGETLRSHFQKDEVLKRKIEELGGNFDAIVSELRDCIKHDPDMLEQVTNWRREIEREVGELKKTHRDHLFEDHSPKYHAQPQAKGGVTRDKLIPGRSVLRASYLSEYDLALFVRYNRAPFLPGVNLVCVWLYSESSSIKTGEETNWEEKTCIHVFDFPQDSGSSKGGEE